MYIWRTGKEARLAVSQIFISFYLIFGIISLRKMSMVVLPFIVRVAFSNESKVTAAW